MTDPKDPTDIGDVDWDEALAEWEEKSFSPEVARDVVTDKPAAMSGPTAPRPLYRPPTPTTDPRPPSPPVSAVETAAMEADDDDGGATLIAAIPHELLRRGDDRGRASASRGGLGQLFARDTPAEPAGDKAPVAHEPADPPDVVTSAKSVSSQSEGPAVEPRRRAPAVDGTEAVREGEFFDPFAEDDRSRPPDCPPPSKPPPPHAAPGADRRTPQTTTAHTEGARTDRSALSTHAKAEMARTGRGGLPLAATAEAARLPRSMVPLVAKAEASRPSRGVPFTGPKIEGPRLDRGASPVSLKAPGVRAERGMPPVTPRAEPAHMDRRAPSVVPKAEPPNPDRRLPSIAPKPDPLRSDRNLPPVAPRSTLRPWVASSPPSRPEPSRFGWSETCRPLPPRRIPRTWNEAFRRSTGRPSSRRTTSKRRCGTNPGWGRPSRARRSTTRGRCPGTRQKHPFESRPSLPLRRRRRRSRRLRGPPCRRCGPTSDRPTIGSTRRRERPSNSVPDGSKRKRGLWATRPRAREPCWRAANCSRSSGVVKKPRLSRPRHAIPRRPSRLPTVSREC